MSMRRIIPTVIAFALTLTGLAGVSIALAASPAAAAATTSPGAYVPVALARILDTGSGNGAPNALVASHAIVTVQVAGRGGIPASGAGAVVLNVTLASPTNSGYVTVYPAGATRPTTSSLNFPALRTVANLVTVRLGASGQVSFYNGSAGTVRLVADVSGYYLDGTATVAGALQPVGPARILDTGSGVGAPRASVASHATLTLQVTGRGGVPASGAGAVVLTVTVAGPTGSGYVTAYPTGTARPTASNLNFPAGLTVANQVTVRLGTGGRVSLYNGSGGTLRLVADVAGYYLAGTPTDAGVLHALPPTRILDTGAGLGAPKAAVPPQGGVALQVTGRGGVPTVGASAVVLNVTVASPTHGGHLTAFPSGTSLPATSNLNFVAGQARANQVILKLGPDGKVDFHNASNGTLRLVADVAGYFASNTGSLTWGAATEIATDFTMRDTDCVTTTFCIAVGSSTTGEAQSFTYNGASWAPPVDTGVGLIAVSCSAPTFCVASTGSGGVETFNGSTWSTPTQVTPAGHVIFGISCRSTTFCIAVDTHFLDDEGNNTGTIYGFNGTAWTTFAGSSPGLESVSCVSTTFCLAAGFGGNPLRFNGTVWSPTPTLPNLGINKTVSCVSTTFCMLSGYNEVSGGGKSVYDGSTWTTSDTVGDQSVSCTSPTFCLAATPGDTQTYNGTSWTSPAAYPAGISRNVTVSCATSTFCVQLTSDGYARTFNGTTFTAFDPVRPEQSIVEDVSCGTATTCTAVTYGGFAVRYAGGTWSAPEAITNRAALRGISCASASFCVAFADDGDVYRSSGGTWSGPEHVGPSLLAVSCASPTFCIALSLDSAFRFNGSSWSAATLVDSTQELADVSCPTATFCAAVGHGTQPAFTFNGTNWSLVSSVDAPLWRVSCATASSCTAVGDSNVTFDGTTWSVAAAPRLDGISCPSVDFCAGRAGTTAYTRDGDLWSDGVTIPGAEFGTGRISCPSAQLCVAVVGATAVSVGT